MTIIRQGMEPSDGERFVPALSTLREVRVNMERYMYAMRFLEGKTVLDCGCGAGLGTYLYSLVAQDVIGIDYSDKAFALAEKYPHPIPVKFLKRDMEKSESYADLPSADVAVALEFIEHLANPDYFLGQIKVNELIFSIPLNSLEVSEWHKYDFRTMEDVSRLISPFFRIEEMRVQEGIWVIGRGIKI